jgi:hypothetical protein
VVGDPEQLGELGAGVSVALPEFGEVGFLLV